MALFAAILLSVSMCVAQAGGAEKPDVAWLLELQKNPELMTAIGELTTKLHRIELPPSREKSRLLPLLPESTVFYAALPNYGEASHQALTIFQQELKESPALRAWWQKGALAENGPKVESALEEFSELSQFLGEEIVVSVAVEGRQGPSPTILAEIRKPGLKDFLQKMAKQLADNSKPPFRVFDIKELATTKDTFPPQEPVILVRPDLVVATLDFAQLRVINAMLDGNKKEFVASSFGQRVAQAYDGGITVVGAIDLQQILKQVPPSANPGRLIFQNSGFADVKYLVWEHRSAAGQASSESELSFNGPRHGVASWLAAPGAMGSLDFVSPKAVLVSSVLLKNPAELLDELRELATASNPKAFDPVAQMEAALKLSLKEDLMRRLGGEITLEVDSLQPPTPEWKAIFQVNDVERLQATVSTLLAALHFNAHESEEEGVDYHAFQIPSANKTVEITYAFVDGYLVIASSSKTIIEALRLHRSGGSLAKSTKFLASLPPGHGSDVSGLFYENPTAVAALSIRQAFPEIAESLSHTTAETAPLVISAYGEESAIRDASMNAGVDVGAILVGAAIAIPNLLRARIAANEASAAATIRTANTAEISYASAYPQRGFSRDLAALGPDPSRESGYSAEHAGLIDSELGNASCTAGKWCTKSGFQFTITAVCKKQSCDEYVVVGTPVSGSTGTRSFCSTSDGVVRVMTATPSTLPIGVAQCRGWPALQ